MRERPDGRQSAYLVRRAEAQKHLFVRDDETSAIGEMPSLAARIRRLFEIPHVS